MLPTTKFTKTDFHSTLSIVVPYAIKEEWVSSLREIAPSLSVVDHHGRRRDQGGMNAARS